MQKRAPEISPHLLWEYDLSQFDWDAMKVLVIQRVVPLGWPKDWANQNPVSKYDYQSV